MRWHLSSEVARIGSDSERTYSIWPFLIGFVALGAVGVAALLLGGGASSPTQTIPSFTTTSTAVSTTSTVSADPNAAVTVPGGGPAPAGVSAVNVDGDMTTYRFAVDGTAAVGALHAYVARAQAVPALDGASVIVSVACTEGDQESLSEIRLTEDEVTLHVEPVVVAPVFPGTCTASTVQRRVTLPLHSPIGGRQLVLSTPATAVAVPPR